MYKWGNVISKKREEILVVLIYPHIKLQITERRQKLFCVRWATCNVISE